MALQSSGAIKLSEIQTEFGGSNPISLSEYYGDHSSLPSSGAISMSDFYGLANSTTYTWRFTFTTGAKDSYQPDTGSPEDHLYTTGDTLPDLFTSSYTVPTNREIRLFLSPGIPGNTSTFNRPKFSMVVADSTSTSVPRSSESFWTSYPFKTGTTILMRNTTASQTVDSWNGSDTHADANFGQAGHWFYPNNQTKADGEANGWDDFDNPPSTNGDTVEIQITVPG